LRFGVIVTEPSMSGLHDLQRAAELTRHFQVPAFVAVNKADLHEKTAREIEAWCEANGIKPLGRIPFDPAVVEAMSGQKSLVETSDGTAPTAARSPLERLAAETGCGMRKQSLHRHAPSSAGWHCIALRREPAGA
jgi:MinD superfamily P-loop ATPase